MRRPLLNMIEFTTQHEDQLHMMQKYMTTKRGRRAVDDITAENFKHSAAVSLKATSCLARIAMAMAAEKVFSKQVELMKNAEFLTLCPREFAVPMPEAAAFQPSGLIKWAREIMGDCNHVSVVDLAYYSNFSVKAGTNGTAHFHVHAIRWNQNEHPIAPALDEGVMAETHSLLTGRTACHALRLNNRMVVERAIYMLKMPLSEYRAYRQMVKKEDPQTHEKFKVPTENYFQQARPLRPGDVAKIMRVFGDRDIPSLVFAGGAGVEMLDTILRRARRHVERQSQIIKPSNEKEFGLDT